MRIAILDFDDFRNPLLNAGQARSTLEVGRRLAEKGNRVTVISSRYPGCRSRREFGIIYRHIGLGTRFIRLNNIGYIFSLPFIVRKINADIILECFTAPVSTLFSPLFTNIPVVAKPTSFEAERFARLYHLPFNWIEKFGCRYYKYFLPANQFHLKKMREINPKIKCRLIPEGVGNKYFKIKKSQPKHILFLGRLDSSQKGIDLLLSAYAGLKNRFAWPLVIAGSGPDKTKIRKLIKDMGLERRIIMPGPVYGEKKLRTMAESLFVVLPSRHEGFGLFALEALAAGLPVICFDIDGFSWISGAASLKAKPFDVNELIDKIELLAGDKDLYDQCSASAKTLAKDFSWDKVADQYIDFFKEIIAYEKK